MVKSEYREFAAKLEVLQQVEDSSTGRAYNQDSFGHWVRDLSRWLTYIFYLAGLRGPHILFAHFAFDIAALYFVYIQMPLLALVMWLVAHILDNCDGDLARIRSEAKPEWGEVDVLLHTWGNMAFWIILGILTGSWTIVAAIIALRVVMEHHRGKFGAVGERHGERSKLWKWITLPTNVNIMYTAYVPFALAGLIEIYLCGYLFYYLVASLGQGIVMVRKAAL